MAAGGAHVVDDAYVETPGDCHAENWLTLPRAGGTTLHAGIGCTTKALPRLEFGASIDRYAIGTATQRFVSPGLKLTLVDWPGRFAVGLRADAAIELGPRRLAGGGLVMPVSFTLDARTSLNANLGWQFVRKAHATTRHRGFLGAQIDRAIAPGFSAMAEGFVIGNAKPGIQGGLRWTPGPGRCDIDLLASHGPGSGGSAVTIGLIGRW